jgi:hypothetical protein
MAAKAMHIGAIVRKRQSPGAAKEPEPKAMSFFVRPEASAP